MILKSVDVFSAAKVLGCMYAALGLIIGGLITLLSLAGANIGRGNAGPAALLIGAGAIVVVPVFYGVIGFIGGAIMAALYNVIASVTGGLEIELRRAEERVVDRFREEQ